MHCSWQDEGLQKGPKCLLEERRAEGEKTNMVVLCFRWKIPDQNCLSVKKISDSY